VPPSLPIANSQERHTVTSTFLAFEWAEGTATHEAAYASFFYSLRSRAKAALR